MHNDSDLHTILPPVVVPQLARETEVEVELAEEEAEDTFGINPSLDFLPHPAATIFTPIWPRMNLGRPERERGAERESASGSSRYEDSLIVLGKRKRERGREKGFR